jgi:hypothetical protein
MVITVTLSPPTFLAISASGKMVAATLSLPPALAGFSFFLHEQSKRQQATVAININTIVMYGFLFI